MIRLFAPMDGFQHLAACKGSEPELFFPGRGESCEVARKICEGCEVRKECLDFALKNHIREGVWGGMSERQRKRLRENKKVTA